jgi:hypothetical protein
MDTTIWYWVSRKSAFSTLTAQVLDRLPKVHVNHGATTDGDVDEVASLTNDSFIPHLVEARGHKEQTQQRKRQKVLEVPRKSV